MTLLPKGGEGSTTPHYVGKGSLQGYTPMDTGRQSDIDCVTSWVACTRLTPPTYEQMAPRRSISSFAHRMS
eukprot:10839221-Ditylum_brightwellii.AAC.1